MGSARIISGGPEGRYVVELDFGAAKRDAIVAALEESLAKIEAQRTEAAAKIAEADAKEAAQRERVNAAIAALVELQTRPLPAGSPGYSDAQVRFELAAAAQLERAHAPLRLLAQALEFDRKRLVAERARMAALQMVETRPAWCADFTEDAQPGEVVATVEPGGESDLVVIAPGARAPQASDGELVAREIMSPGQAFWNAAVLPGWQRHLPTYRWGEIVGINYEADTCTVALFDQRSTAQRLPVNAAATLADVPITYMDCNSAAFELFDRVVVQFVGQSWDSPRVIGFLDNPRRCFSWICSGARGLSGDTYFYFRHRNESVEAAIRSALMEGYTFGYGQPLFISPDAFAQVRPAGGSWHTLHAEPGRILSDTGDFCGPGGPFTPVAISPFWTTGGGTTFGSAPSASLRLGVWEPWLTPPPSHWDRGGLFPHERPYYDFVVDFRYESGFGSGLELYIRPFNLPVPEIVEFRIVAGGDTVFHGAFSVGNGSLARVAIKDGGIMLPPGYIAAGNTPLARLNYEFEE
jgi:hypothetical protein